MGQRTQIICRIVDKNYKTGETTTDIYSKHLQWGYGFAMAREVLPVLASGFRRDVVLKILEELDQLKKVEISPFSLPSIKEHCLKREDNNNGAMILDLNYIDRESKIGFLSGEEDVGETAAFTQWLTFEEYLAAQGLKEIEICKDSYQEAAKKHYDESKEIIGLFNHLMKYGEAEYIKRLL